MNQETNDPLAGVPAVDWSSCFDAWWEVYHESPPHVVGDLPATTLEHIQWERQQRLRVEADAAAMREVIELALREYWLRMNLLYRSGFDEMPTTPGAEALQDSLSCEAGWALLRELHDYRAAAEEEARFADEQAARVDELTARVERLRRAFKQAASADHGGEGWAVGGYGLEPGDLEEGN